MQNKNVGVLCLRSGVEWSRIYGEALEWKTWCVGYITTCCGVKDAENILEDNPVCVLKVPVYLQTRLCKCM